MVFHVMVQDEELLVIFQCRFISLGIFFFFFLMLNAIGCVSLCSQKGSSCLLLGKQN